MNSMRNDWEKEVSDFTRTQMKKDTILRELRKRGGRITKQREILLDIILEDTCSCCKEIHYKAVKQDPTIGIATVYRMINSLEEIGAISRKKMYEIQYQKELPEKEKLRNRHRLFQEILLDAGVEPEKAEKVAGMLERILSSGDL